MIVIYSVIVIWIGFVLYMVRQAHENNVRTHSITAEGEKETLRLFFISDTHTRLIDEAMIQQLDTPFHAVIIGGDFVDKRTPWPKIEKNIQLLKQLGPVYFIWGNNDREVGEQRLRKLFQRYDVKIIENEALLMPGCVNRIWLSAVDYQPVAGNIEKALSPCGNNQTIFLAHNPHVFNKVLKQSKPLLMMGGHLHGGQIRLGKFGLQPHGSFSLRQGVQTLVSNGYGTTLAPLRFGAKPECHVINIVISTNK